MIRARVIDDRGSTLPLILFYAGLSLVLILLVVGATSLYLERKRLVTLADGAALVGAEAFDLEDVQVTGSAPSVALDSAQIAAAVEVYLESAAATGFTELRLESASTVDERSATVTLSTEWNPPLLSPLVPAGFRIEVTSTARSVFG